jgi:hypothetical protein
MKYNVTKHLLEMLLKRNIIEEDVCYCLDNYHSDYPNKGHAGCHYYVGKVKGKNLKVLVNTTNWNIITAFWLDSQ